MSDFMRETGLSDEQLLPHTISKIDEIRKGNGVIKVVDQNNKPIDNIAVSVKFKRHEFKFGCLASGLRDQGDAFDEQFKSLFNYATLATFWGLIEPDKGQPDFRYTDAVYRDLLDADIAVKLHPLLYELSLVLPEWHKPADGKSFNKDEQREYITKILTRYENAQYVDVVNEPVHFPNIDIKEPHELTKTLNPSIKRIINEFWMFVDGYPDFHNYLSNLDPNLYEIIGMQGHSVRNFTPCMDKVLWVLNAYHNTLNKPIHITEFQTFSNNSDINSDYYKGKWTEEFQADYTEKFYRLCFAHPGVEAISYWDFSDKHSFAPFGGLLRSDLSPKPVYSRLKDLLTKEWATNTVVLTNGDGEATFRGFKGAYDISLSYNGKTYGIDNFNIRSTGPTSTSQTTIRVDSSVEVVTPQPAEPTPTQPSSGGLLGLLSRLFRRR